MPTARQIATLSTRDIEAQVRPLMRAILEEASRNTLAIGGNQSDWAELFRLVQRPVLNVLRYVFGIVDAEDQDDLFQEVMLRFYRYHRTYDSSRPLLPWLYAIARNVKRDRMAKSRLIVQPLAVEPRASGDVTLKLIAEEVLAKLPEDDRHILWLSYNEGLSDTEISQNLNIALPTTKYYLRRAKQRAREYLTARTKGEK